MLYAHHLGGHLMNEMVILKKNPVQKTFNYSFKVIHPNAAGIDVGSRSNKVTSLCENSKKIYGSLRITLELHKKAIRLISGQSMIS